VLKRLRSQHVPTDTKWEILIVDNNSQDATAEVVKQAQVKWTISAPLRYVFEPKQGLAFARQCGVENAEGEIVGFLDDDNWPQSDWVAEAIEFARLHPNVGSYGGKTTAVFEQPPPYQINAIAKLLALQDYGPHPYQFRPENQILPAGAGLVVRRKAWLSCIPKTLVRVSQGGDDYEISLRLAQQGWDIYYNPKMVIQHFIPAARLERNYLLKLSQNYGFCTCEMMMIGAPLWKQPWLLAKFSLGTIKRLLSHVLLHGLSASEVPTQCRLVFHLGNLQGIGSYLFTSSAFFMHRVK
jgi:glycosyltransferase involved in cell wall biosynthesis